MDWVCIRNTLKEIVTLTTGIPPERVVWRGSLEEGSRVVGTRAVLNTDAINSIGVDEARRDDDEADNANDQMVEIVGPRTFVWKILIEAQAQLPGLTARELIEKLRVRLSRESITERMIAAGIGVAEDRATTHRDFVDDGRFISWAIMDILMNTSERDVDDTPGAGNYIDEVIINGTVKDDAGVERPVVLDVK